MTDILSVISRGDYYPVLGEEVDRASVAEVDLGVDSKGHHRYDLFSYKGLNDYLDEVRRDNEASILYGGYGERRNLYRRAEQYRDPEAPREYHLGVDVWCPPGTPVYAPWEGTVVSALFRAQKRDYGGLIILRHVWPDQMIYTLYGHVSKASVRPFSAGDTVLKGDLIARIAPKEESVGWVPHLHLQSMLDLMDYVDDFPGVASRQQLDTMLENCPDPSPILFAFKLQ